MLMFTEKRLFRVMFVFTPPGLDLISQQYHPVICLLSSVSCHLSLSAFYFPICHHLAGYPAQQVAFFWLKTEAGGEWWRPRHDKVGRTEYRPGPASDRPRLETVSVVWR